LSIDSEEEENQYNMRTGSIPTIMVSSNGGLDAKPVSLSEGKVGGHKYFIEKSQDKARIDMEAGKQISSYRILR
jgi:hypothetical protein